MEQDITLRRLKLFLLVFLGLSLTPGVVNARCYCMNKIVQLLRQDDYRVILSPEFPRPYCPSLNCIWHIVAPDNTSKIHFFSKNIDLRPDRDFIHFYVSEKETVEADLFNPLHSCTGSGYCQFKTEGQFLVIQFKTDNGEPDHYGFQGTVALYDLELNSWISSVLGFIVVALLSVGVTILILGLIYWICLRSKTREPDRKLLAKEDEETKPISETFLKP